MTSPKHLWSGDWEDESDKAAAARDDAAAALPTPEPPAPEPERPAPRQAPQPPVRRPAEDWAAWENSYASPRRDVPPPRNVPPPSQPRSPEAPTTLGQRLRALGGPRGIRYRLVGLVVLIAAVAVGVVLATSGNGHSTPKPLKDYSQDELGLVLQSVPVNRVIVDAVVPGSPADLAGIGASAILLRVNGTAVTSPGQVNQILSKIPQGHEVTLAIDQGTVSGIVQMRVSGSP